MKSSQIEKFMFNLLLNCCSFFFWWWLAEPGIAHGANARIILAFGVCAFLMFDIFTTLQVSFFLLCTGA